MRKIKLILKPRSMNQIWNFGMIEIVLAVLSKNSRKLTCISIHQLPDRSRQLRELKLAPSQAEDIFNFQKLGRQEELKNEGQDLPIRFFLVEVKTFIPRRL